MRRAWIVLTDMLLALFLLATLASVALDLILLRPGDSAIVLVRGVGGTLSSIPVDGAAMPCPQGALAVVQRATMEQAQPGDALVCFGPDGRVFAGVFRGLRDGQAAMAVGGSQVLVDPRQVKARYIYVLPGAYNIYERMGTPRFIAIAGGTVFVLFVAARIDWRRGRRPLSPTDDEISSMFR